MMTEPQTDAQEYLDKEQTAQLEAAAAGLRDRLLIRFPRVLGCRISEALGVAVEDLNFKQGTVTIIHEKVRTSLSCPKCGAHIGKKHQWCPECGARVLGALKDQQQKQRYRVIPIDHETLTLVRTFANLHGPVLVGDRHILFPFSRQRAWQIFTETAIRAGLPKIINPETQKFHKVGPHKLRDAFAVNAIKHDDSTDGVRQLQEQLGHKEIGTTMRYRKVAGKEQRQWYDELMGSGPPAPAGPAQ